MIGPQLHFLKIQLSSGVHTKGIKNMIENPYLIHQFLSTLKRKDHDRVRDRMLFRLDLDPMNAPFVIAQTNFEPRTKGIAEIEDSDLVRRLAYKQIQPRFQKHEVFRFRLRANPTKLTTAPDGSTGGRKVRQPILDEMELETWMARKGEDHGFSMVLQNLKKEGPVSFEKGDRIAGGSKTRTKRLVTLHSVLFEGTLQIRIGAKVTNAFAMGIGRGKGFGFGMLSLARR